MINLNQVQKLLDEANKLSSNPFSIDSYCFDKQIDFIRDKARFKTAVCSRRSGKTVACAADLSRAAASKEGIVCLYITLSRSNGKRIIWPELKELNRRFNLGGKANESELSITFQNRSVIYVSGANDQKEVEKFRGLPIYLCYIDECQSFRPYIQNLVDEVISKALFDYNGTLCLIGTPGPVPAGFFYECANSKGWSHHSWTMFENPWLEKKSGKTPQQLINEELDRKGTTVDDPTIQRECYARWVIDQNALVFKYSPKTNHFDLNDIEAVTAQPWNYIMGVDIGFEDADAICILGYNERLKACYLVEESVEVKQGITALVKRIYDLEHKYKPDKIVMDTGGLGKKIAEEITSRYSIMIEPAQKERKFEFIELLNDAMRTGKFFASKFSRFAQDAQILEWDRDPERILEKPRINPSYHSDITDSVLYAFRESFHWLFTPEKPKIIPGSPEWLQKEVEEIEETLIRNLKCDDLDPWQQQENMPNDFN